MDEKVKNLSDYLKPNFVVSEIFLDVDLYDDDTHVRSVMKIVRNRDSDDTKNDLYLNGENLKLLSIKLNGKELNPRDYRLDDKSLTVLNVDDECELEINNSISPAANKALLGLYKSEGMFCTQNEAEGFRRITFYMDRPDVMSIFTTKIRADKKTCPVLLSNGNPLERGDLPNDRHFVVWRDPFKKPSYLYALVAGDLGVVKDFFVTRSGRNIRLEIYCDHGNEPKCFFAMESLKKAMRWDEEKFGFEYDLDIFMIVAVGSFNMGAMENKGLNIFNSALVLADPISTTDDSFQRIEGVVGHEYFHNYTGNRITCRDWFQLTLKEGLTVFRDQEFSADMNSRSVQRIMDVKRLWERQFPEDQGPTAHPIKPKSYLEIDNFYTPTVYEKGAEVIRMLYVMLGHDGFHRGMRKYFELYDGQAVTTEDFLHAMSLANGDKDLVQFRQSWYDQSGTPKVRIRERYDNLQKIYYLHVDQLLETHQVIPFHFPLKFGLLAPDGSLIRDETIEIKKIGSEFAFKDIRSRPILSLNRGYSAPILFEREDSLDTGIFLLRYDKDDFARYDIHQKLVSKIIIDGLRTGTCEVPETYLESWRSLLDDHEIDDGFKAFCLGIPSENSLHQLQNPIAVQDTHRIRKQFISAIAQRWSGDVNEYYHKLCADKKYQYSSKELGRRQLKNHLLSVLMAQPTSDLYQLVYDSMKKADNMTDEYACFRLLVRTENPFRENAIGEFYAKWKHDKLVLQTWMGAIAGSPLPDTLTRVRRIMMSSDYDQTVPNIVRTLFRTFSENYIHFHADDGSGYDFITQRICELDDINPNVASMLAKSFAVFERLPMNLQSVMKPFLIKIREKPQLSKNSKEIIQCILKDV